MTSIGTNDTSYELNTSILELFKVVGVGIQLSNGVCLFISILGINRKPVVFAETNKLNLTTKINNLRSANKLFRKIRG